MRKVIALTVLLGGCARTAVPAPLGLDGALPDAVAGFRAGPLERGEGFVRRSYRRGRTEILATLASYPLTPAQWDDWVRASAGYPPASVGLPGGRASGFYQCSPGPRPDCDLLLQLRSGYHLELHAGPGASKDDVDALASGLPLAPLAAPTGGRGS